MQELQFYNKRFETVVRNALQIFDKPITAEDAQKAEQLSCWEFTFDIEDCDTLSAFKNLTYLEINVGFEDLSFLENLTNLTHLYLDFYRSNFNTGYLLPLKKLQLDLLKTKQSKLQQLNSTAT